MNRIELVEVAAETIGILEQGFYTGPSGGRVELNVREIISMTYLPEIEREDFHRDYPTVIEVTDETTAEAGRRLQEEKPVVLNFASATNVGGGFLSGSTAQEEDLCRASALYHCLLNEPDYYKANRGTHPYYTSTLVYSCMVPFFRDRNLTLLEEPFFLSVVTCPAPNQRKAKLDEPTLKKVFSKRIKTVLSRMAERGHKTVVLGAWGCGAFKNDPGMVAGLFAEALEDPLLKGAFNRVVFAVYDPSAERKNFKAFQKQFSKEEK